MIVSKIASEYGNGDIHITTRQGFEILGIKMEDMGEVNKLIQPVIEKMDINQGEKTLDIQRQELEIYVLV